MSLISTELGKFTQWPSDQRTAAIQRLIPQTILDSVLHPNLQQAPPCPRLPPWFMLWFVVGIALFQRDSYRQIFKWLQPFQPNNTPARSTLCMARQRLGVAPLRLLYELTAALLAQTNTPHAFHRRYRLMGLDGFVVDLHDSPDNHRVFGRPGSKGQPSAFPQARVLSLCELGTHLLWRSLIKPLARGEVTMAPALLRHLTSDMLLLWDRNFFSYNLVHRVVVQQRAQLLARVRTNLIFQPIRTLSDGSYLAKVYQSARHRKHGQGGIEVRIIEYTLTDPARVGCGQTHRLLTTLLDEQVDKAKDLVLLYHERWEEELAIDELKTHQRERLVLRSQSPAGVVQELYGLLTAHSLIRRLMMEGSCRVGTSPRRMSFTGTLKIVRCRIAESASDEEGRKKWYESLVLEVAEEVLPPRRPRINPRVIKKKLSPWPKKQPTPRSERLPVKQFRDTVQILR